MVSVVVNIFSCFFLFSKWQKFQLQRELKQNVKSISWINVLNSSQVWLDPGTEHKHLSLLVLLSGVALVFRVHIVTRSLPNAPGLYPPRFKPNRKSTHLVQQSWEQAFLIYGVPETYTVPDTLRMLNQYLLNWFYIELWIKPIWNIGTCIEVGCRHRSELWPLGSPRVAPGKSLNLSALVSLAAKDGTLILYLANLLWYRRRGNSPATSPEILWLV